MAQGSRQRGIWPCREQTAPLAGVEPQQASKGIRQGIPGGVVPPTTFPSKGDEGGVGSWARARAVGMSSLESGV